MASGGGPVVSISNKDSSMEVDPEDRTSKNVVKETSMSGGDPNQTGDSLADPPGSGDVSEQAAKLASDSIRINLLTRVANSDGLFKHQLLGEPDLTFEEKYEIATDILKNKPSMFLTRYGKFLQEEDLQYFIPLRSDYVIDFQVKEIKQMMDNGKNETKIRNRRYEAMKKLMEEGEYFGDEEMKGRDPLLYQEMLGKYMTEEEAQAKVDKSDLRFSTVLLSHIDMIKNNEILKLQTEIEESQMEEEEEDEEEEEEEEVVEPSESISEVEKLMLRNEFVSTMQMRFLRGEDRDFDYSKVDNNAEYDSLDIREHDEEEKYFDEEDEESVQSEKDGAQCMDNDEEIDDYLTYEPKPS